MLTGKTLKSYYDRLQSIKTGPTDINEYPELNEAKTETVIQIIDPNDSDLKNKARDMGVAWKSGGRNVVGKNVVDLSGPRDKVIKYLKFHYGLSGDAEYDLKNLHPELREDYIEEESAFEKIFKRVAKGETTSQNELVKKSDVVYKGRDGDAEDVFVGVGHDGVYFIVDTNGELKFSSQKDWLAQITIAIKRGNGFTEPELEESSKEDLEESTGDIGVFVKNSELADIFDENPDLTTSTLPNTGGVIEFEGFAKGALPGKYAVRVGGGMQVYDKLEYATAYAKDDFDESAELEEAAGAELTEDGKRMILQRVNGIIDFIDSEMKGSSIEFTEAYNYWIHHESADFISEDLREIVGDSFDVSSKEDLEEGVDKSSPIYKEYEKLKKLPIKSLRNKLSLTHKIVDLKGYDKEGAISQILRDKHGDKKVDAAFGFSEKRRRS